MANLIFASQSRKAQLVDANGNAIGAADGAPLIARPPRSAFGSFGMLKSVGEQPEVHLAFLYNINSALVSSATANGGTVTQAASHAVLQTSTANNGSAQIQSTQALKYIAGQGVIIRFTALFATGVANSQQEIGLGDATDGLLFGYVGATFGIIHRNGGVDTFIPQSSWNGDKFNGTGPSGVTLDPTKGNLYVIQVQWLGYGANRFFIEDPITGDMVLAHTIFRANNATSPSLTNPTLPLHARIINSGNATNLTLRTASMGAYREGPTATWGARGSAYNRKTGITTETSILAIQNNTTFAGTTNKIQARLDILSISSTVDTVFRLAINPTLGGSPSFTDFSSTTSAISIDTAGTTRTDGRVIFSFVAENGNGHVFDLSRYSHWLFPGDILAITAASVSGNASPQAAISWFEDF